MNAKIEKRIKELEAVMPKENTLNGLGELYEWEQTPEGQRELDKLYNPDRNESE